MNKDNNVEVLDDFDDLLDDEVSEKAFEENSDAVAMEAPRSEGISVEEPTQEQPVSAETPVEEVVTPVVPIVEPMMTTTPTVAPMSEIPPVEPVAVMPEIVAESVAPVSTPVYEDEMPQAVSMDTVAPVPTVEPVETFQEESVGPAYAFVDPLAGTVAEEQHVAPKKEKKSSVKLDQGTKKNLTFIIIIGIILLAVVIALPFFI